RLGFEARVSDQTLPYSLVRDRDGRTSLTVPFDHGAAIIRFAPSQRAAFSSADVIVGLGALALASLIGLAVGRSLTSDLVRVTDRLARLSTDEVLRGSLPDAPKARWRIVKRLNEAIDTLTERSRVFAEAQERAIAARE